MRAPGPSKAKVVWGRVHKTGSPLLHLSQCYSPSSPKDTGTILLTGFDVLFMPTILGIPEGHPTFLIETSLAREDTPLGKDLETKHLRFTVPTTTP